MCYKNKIEDDIYWGSSKYLDNDYLIYGVENFSKEIIKADYTNVKDMLDGESFYMHQYNAFEPNGYNRYDPTKTPGWHMGGCKMSEESKQKISEAFQRNGSKKGKNHHMWGKHLTEEHKLILSNSRKGKHHSEETKNILSEKAKKRPPTFGNQKTFSEQEIEYIIKRHTIENAPYGRIAAELNLHKDRIKRFLIANNL